MKNTQQYDPKGYSTMLSGPEAQFLSYVRITLMFEAKRLAKRARLRLQSEILASNDIQDVLATLEDPSHERSHTQAMRDLDDVLSDERYYQACQTLTTVQREILFRTIVMDESEKCVAFGHGVSQQAINKSKHTALQKLCVALGIKHLA